MAEFCNNRIWDCSQEVVTKQSLCSDCFTDVARYALGELLDDIFDKFDKNNPDGEYPQHPCPICRDSTRAPICENCYHTLQSIKSAVIVTR